VTSAREREGSVSLLQQRHLGRRQPGVGVSQSRTQSSHRLAPRHLLHRQRVKQPSGELLEPRLQVRVCTSAFSTSDATMQRLYVRPHGLHTLMRPASRKAVLVDAVHWYVLCRQQYTALPACLPPAAEQPARAMCAAALAACRRGAAMSRSREWNVTCATCHTSVGHPISIISPPSSPRGQERGGSGRRRAWNTVPSAQWQLRSKLLCKLMAVKGTKPTNVTVMATKESKITNRWQLRNAIIFRVILIGAIIIF